MKEPTKILVKTDMLTLEGIAQYYIGLESEQDKYETLCFDSSLNSVIKGDLNFKY